VSTPHTPTPEVVEDDKAIYKHAFWLYGVIVGLAIKDGVDSVVPHLINLGGAASANVAHPPHGLYLEILRLFTFLFLAVRFYLGSAYYFGLIHESNQGAILFPRRSFGSDFILGFFHFLAFAFLALTIHVHVGEPMRLFPLGVAFVLGYDVVWFVYSWLYKLDTRRKIKWWAIVNGGVLVICVALYLSVEKFTSDSLRAEIWTLWLVFWVTLFDIGWMMRRKPFFQPVRKWLVGDEDATAPH
jgi:hypothetical protein